MSRRRALAAGAALVIVGAAIVVVLLGGPFSGGGRPPVLNPASVAATVVPGASAALIAPRAAAPGAQRLQIMLPAAAIHPPAGSGPLETDPTTASVYAGAGWRGAMIASVVAPTDPALTQFVTTDKTGGQAPGASFYLDGVLRTAPGQQPAAMPMLDRVAPARERKQLDDNIRTLIAGLPPGSVIRAGVRQIPVDPAVRGMAYAVSLRVTDLRRLRFRFGDIFSGLATGLAPGPDSTVEGLAIHVEDAAGRTAGSWIATRAAQGTTVVDPRLRLPRIEVPHIHFVDETGGPKPVASAPAGPAG
ncbi:MAG TPA: hypothetical protein VG165_02070 [Solirubrobacteraceae bacterium]|nr:hypothetical protein [Solirubrobacteraceae bacterium]